jgi:hypothetical protein
MTCIKEHRTAYQIYWDCVIGPQHSAESAVQAYDLVPGNLRGFQEWVGQAQEIAVSQGADLDNLDCGALSTRCAKELQDAAESFWRKVGEESADGYLADEVWGTEEDARLPDPAECQTVAECRAFAKELRDFAEQQRPYRPYGVALLMSMDDLDAVSEAVNRGESAVFLDKADAFEERARDLAEASEAEG